MPLSSKTNLDHFKQLANKIAVWLKQRVSFIDMQGKVLFSSTDLASEYDKFLAAHSSAISRLEHERKSFLNKGVHSQKDVLFFDDFTGCTNILVPVCVRGEFLGALLCAGIRRHKQMMRFAQDLAAMTQTQILDVARLLSALPVQGQEECVRIGYALRSAILSMRTLQDIADVHMQIGSQAENKESTSKIPTYHAIGQETTQRKKKEEEEQTQVIRSSLVHDAHSILHDKRIVSLDQKFKAVCQLLLDRGIIARIILFEDARCRDIHLGRESLSSEEKEIINAVLGHEELVDVSLAGKDMTVYPLTVPSRCSGVLLIEKRYTFKGQKSEQQKDLLVICSLLEHALFCEKSSQTQYCGIQQQ